MTNGKYEEGSVRSLISGPNPEFSYRHWRKQWKTLFKIVWSRPGFKPGTSGICVRSVNAWAYFLGSPRWNQYLRTHDVTGSSGYRSNFIFRPFRVQISTLETGYPDRFSSINNTTTNTSTKQSTSNTGLHIKPVVFIQVFFWVYCDHVAIRQSRRGQTRIVTEFFFPTGEQWKFMVTGTCQESNKMFLKVSQRMAQMQRGTFWLKKRTWNHMKIYYFMKNGPVFPSTL